MLVLNRREQERIRIGDDITIVIVRVKGEHVRVGIEAPDDVEVHREEVYLQIKAGLRRDPRRED
jgi:carbon storage regulator